VSALDDGPSPVLIAAAALVRDGRVLLVHRRRSRRAYPDCWDLAGGHVEAGESPRQAVKRESLEELGVTVKDPVPMRLTHTDPALDIHAFLITRWQGEPRNAAPDEHDDLRWFSSTDLTGLKLAHPASLPDIVNAIRSVRGGSGTGAT